MRRAACQRQLTYFDFNVGGASAPLQTITEKLNKKKKGETR